MICEKCGFSGNVVVFKEGKPSWQACDCKIPTFGPSEFVIGKQKNQLQGHKVFKFEDVQDKLMAHLIAEIGLFPSVSQAKKNGWDRPVERGTFKLKKGQFVLEVV